jgi:gluconate kinase
MGIGIALDDKSARQWWPDLKAILLTTKNATVRDRLAAVLSGIAIKANYDDLLTFLNQQSLGEARIYFLRPINRIGNRMTPGKGRSVVEALADDPQFAAEAKAILAGRAPND